MSAPLLATKFFIPQLNARRVLRSRLVCRLDEALQHRLTLLSAPAGFGKTILLSDWAQSTQRAVAWVSLDESDNDVARFWGYVFAALQGAPALSGIIEDRHASPFAAPSPAIEPALTAFINAIAAHATFEDFALVLDDYHVIGSPLIHDSLAFLIDHLPPSMHILIASRADPPLPLARLRARDQLLELRAHDLRFTTDEVSAFINDTMQLNLSTEDVVELEARTEGWITGLHLAARSLQSCADPTSLIRTFSGEHHFVLEYLVEEVLSRQPKHVRRFLEQASILDQLCAPLCEALTDRSDASALLKQLWHDNLFIEPLDEIGEWYRWHHLLAEVLFAQLQDSQPDLIPQLRHRARDWYAQHGYLHQAMRHALAAEEFDWAADTVEHQYRALISRSELATLRTWLDALPATLVAARPRCSMAYVWASIYSGRYDVLDQHLTHAEAALEGLDDVQRRNLRGEILALRAVSGSLRGETIHTLAAAQESLTLVEDDRVLKAMAHQAIGNAYRLQGKADKAQAAFEQALPLAPSVGAPAVLAVTVRLGQTQAMQGRSHQALRTFRRALDLASTQGGVLPLYAGEAHIRLGDIYREWNRIDIALEHVTTGIELAKRADNVTAMLAGYFTLTHIQVARGEMPCAHDTLQMAEQLAARYDFAHLDQRTASHRAWLDWMCGDRDSVMCWIDEYTTDRALLQTEIMTDLQDALLARVQIERRQFDDAHNTLTQLLHATESAGRGWTALQAQMLQAMAFEAQGEYVEALSAIKRVLSCAAPEGYLRLFIDEGEPLRSLIEDVRSSISDSRLLIYVEQILSAYPDVASMSPSEILDRPSELIDSLSARELEVLRLIAEGGSNQSIADALVISVGTVKSHINRILGKLDARNRTEAVAHARTLGLL